MIIENVLNWLKKNLNNKDWLIITALIIFFFLTRLTNLERFPIFSDEGIYIRWAKVAWKDASWRFISLTDGKQPLQTWATIPFLKLFPNRALLAGRLFSVTTGFIAVSGLFVLLYYLWNKKTAYIGTLLAVTSPYLLLYDRMALSDSAVNSAFIWILFFSILLIRTLRLDTALLFGLVMGVAFLTKSSVRLFAGIATLAPLIYLNPKEKNILKKTVDYLLLFSLALLIGLLIYNIQRLSPFFHYIAQKNNTFVMTLEEFKKNPFAVIGSNLKTIPLYVFWEAGWLIVPFSFLGIIYLWRKQQNLALYLSLWFMIPYLLIATMTKVLYPRYLIFFNSLLIITATYFLYHYKPKKIRQIIFVILICWNFVFSYPLIFDPPRAFLPPVDRGQYIEGATAVWGAHELVELVRKNSKTKPVLLLAEGDFGLVADVLRVLVNEGEPVEIKGLWPLGSQEILSFQKEKASKQVYIVFSHRENFPPEWPIKLVKKFPKPGNKKALYLFEYAN